MDLNLNSPLISAHPWLHKQPATTSTFHITTMADSDNKPVYLTEEDIKPFLKWDTLVPAIEQVMGDISNKDLAAGDIVQPPRLIMAIPQQKGFLFTMPGYSGAKDALGCKLVTAFGNNVEKGLPSIMATILLFNASTGKVEVIMEGTEITAWRTAAASFIATKYLNNGTKVLAILGSGTQARSHARVLDHFYHFQQIRIWNHRNEGAQRLAKELADEGKLAVACESAEECVRDADIIVTATYATKPILQRKWIKPGVHINAVGAGVNHHSELDTELYQAATIFTDTLEGAKVELRGLRDIGVTIQGEVGELVQGTIPSPRKDITVFHSLGMAVEDAVSAKLIYEEYKKRNE